MGRKTSEDPTGQSSNRRKGSLTLAVRLNRAEKAIKALFRKIPSKRRQKTKIQNAEQTTVTDYQYTALDQMRFEEAVEIILDEELLQTQFETMPPDWYWKANIEQPYREAAAEEVRDFNQLIAAAVIAGTLVLGLPPRQILFDQVVVSTGYISVLESLQVSNFGVIRSLSERTAAQVLGKINTGIQAGMSKSAIIDDITERFDVSRSSAKRIANTEINRAYNDSKLNATRIIGEQTGMRAAVIHISALLPTTRETHAARHGNVYTVEDQLQWWNTGSNRIECKCTIITVLIDNKGNLVDSELQKLIKDEGRRFFIEARAA